VVVALFKKPLQSPDLKPIEMVWDELDRQSEGKAANKCSAYVGTTSYVGTTVGKAFQVKLIDRMPRMCKAVIKVATLKNLKSKIYVFLFNTFFGFLHDSMCYFIVLMPSLLFSNVEIPLNE
jgi:hypothetical protein